MVIITIKVNVNHPRTLEQNLELRKQMVITAGENLKKEIKFDLRLISNESFVLLGFDEEIELLIKLAPDWFNSDVNYKRALEKLLDLKQITITNLVRQIADVDQTVRQKIQAVSFVRLRSKKLQNSNRTSSVF